MSIQIRCKQCGNVFESNASGATGHEVCLECASSADQTLLATLQTGNFRQSSAINLQAHMDSVFIEGGKE